MYSLYLNNTGFWRFCNLVDSLRRNQNKEFSFPFFVGSSPDPSTENMIVRNNSLVLVPSGARQRGAQNHHVIRAYGEVQSHHARGACEVSRFATGKKFGFHHIDGASQNKRQNLGRLRRQEAENPRGFSRGFATKPEARDPAKAGSMFSEHSLHSQSEPIFFLLLSQKLKQ